MWLWAVLRLIKEINRLITCETIDYDEYKYYLLRYNKSSQGKMEDL